MMRKALAVSMCLSLLLAQTPLQQLLKLPLLWQHYQVHRHSNPNLNFSEFLFIHYVTDDGNPDDNNLDNQLPFHNKSLVFPVFCFDWQQGCCVSEFRHPAEGTVHHPFSHIWLPESHSESHWQPPRV